MESRHRELLLRMRDEEQLPQKLITMVERAELNLRRIGVNTLDARDLVVLSAVVPIAEKPDSGQVGKVVPLIVGTLVKVSHNGDIRNGKIVGEHGRKFRVKVDGDKKPWRVFEVQYLEAI